MKLKTLKNSRFLVRCTKPYRATLKRLARRERLTLSDYVRMLIDREIAKDGNGDKIL